MYNNLCQCYLEEERSGRGMEEEGTLARSCFVRSVIWCNILIEGVKTGNKRRSDGFELCLLAC